ncbi:MAG: hypothetical protein Q8942_12170 [Bacillota bacterium]|nr:hypothetical protein [Bacillota bacterium]
MFFIKITAAFICLFGLFLIKKDKIIRSLRKIGILRKPKISMEQALNIANREYSKRWGSQGWQPQIYDNMRSWMVITRKNTKGAPVIIIDNITGNISKVFELRR